ncbi:Ig-like domain-containing protein [Clostridium beijerinckii]|uniref:Ig-like domain-containing protein n=1 Tax=Clostridium beijerinckii TaxID=1520 RepID=UPI00156D5AD6|nr:glucan-binding YG repeat protein [Clostridium beijerinckii]
MKNVKAIDDIYVDNGTKKGDIGLPETIDVDLNNNTTTSAAVVWDDGTPVYDKDNEGTYTFTGTLIMPSGVINSHSLKASVDVIVKPEDDQSNVTTPASVTIKGIDTVGNTLETELLTSSGTKFTTSSAVTYDWYRLSSIDADNGDVIGSGETYKLVNSDAGKYIKVSVNYDGKTFEDVTGKILGISSSSSSSHHHSDKNNNNNTTETNNSSNGGVTHNGWENAANGAKRYIENGHTVVGWRQINGSWYLFNSTGNMQTDWRLG